MIYSSHLRDLLPCGFSAIIKEMKEEHHQWATQFNHQSIQERDNRIQTIQYKNVGLQC